MSAHHKASSHNKAKSGAGVNPPSGSTSGSTGGETVANKAVAFEVEVGGGEVKGQPPARLKEQLEREKEELTREELEKKMQEAEKRRSQVQEQRIEKIKDVTMSGFIGKPEVPPPDEEQ